jgi:serine/threonine-protein kinase ATR
MLGLGDRHLDNILFEPKTGKIIHIDFECLFNKGKELGVPEIVDFRLTKNLRYGLGYLLEQGLFLVLVREILQVLVENQEGIIDFLDPFIYDPLLCRMSVKDVVEYFNKRL